MLHSLVGKLCCSLTDILTTKMSKIFAIICLSCPSFCPHTASYIPTVVVILQSGQQLLPNIASQILVLNCQAQFQLAVKFSQIELR